MKNFNEKSFWNKISHNAKKIGRLFLINIFTLYYCMLDRDTPVPAKLAIAGALAYFILPTDLIPDWLPGGFGDDAAAIASALTAVNNFVKSEHKATAEEQVNRWL